MLPSANLLLAAIAAAFPTIAQARVIHPGTNPTRPGPATTFTGTVTVEPLTRASPPGRTGTAIVSFTRGARSHWHRHPAGQTLYVTEGCGWTQVEGGPVERICKGDTVYAAPGTKHWHGATRTSAMRHLAITETVAGQNVEWLEPVSDAQFNGPLTTQDDQPMPDEPTNARKSFGDIAPKLAEITDKVLFGDVWEDTALTPRERSLVTITNLVALYRHNELGFHIRRGLDNGLTQDEIIAVITHSAFYSGWPTAMTAIGIAREAFKPQ